MTRHDGAQRGLTLVQAAAPGAPTLSPAALQQAAQAMGVAMPAPIAVTLLAYLALLQRWNQVYNLTALRDPQTMLTHHLLDCLAVLPALDSALGAKGPYGPDRPNGPMGWKGPTGPTGPMGWMGPTGPTGRAGETALTGHTVPAGPAPANFPTVRVLDVGSGGGLPGVVLAIMRPNWHVDCVDAVAKKAGFIRQVAAELRLANLQGLHARVEQLTAPAAVPSKCLTAGYQLITSRAFASLADFVTLSAPLLSPDGLWAAMKGLPTAEERAAVPPWVEVFHVEQLQVPGLDAQRCLVWLRPNAAAAQAG